jgi:hypothetical protein
MKKLIITSIFITACALAQMALPPAYGQDTGDRIVVNFSDPSRPGLLKINLVNGSVSIKAYSGREVTVESQSRNRRDREPQTRDGLRRIDTTARGLVVEEENNVISITSRNPNDTGNLEIQVPAKTNLNLRSVNGGSTVVEGVEGELEITNINSSVRLDNVAGSVVAHSTNGGVKVTLREITPNKPMSFTSMNGGVDVTVPAAAKANLKLRADNGAIYSDFDVQIKPTAPTVDDRRNQGGRYRIETDKTVNGTINGGGPDFEMRTLNGNIYLRKAK